jgi:SAM-dependent methyltransferase
MPPPSRPSTPAYDDAFFATQGTDDRSAALVWPHVLRLIEPTSVVDVGCGIGTWLRTLAEIHDCEILGIDGAYVPAERRRIPADRFVERDLGLPLRLDRAFDLAICLEVAEHLPDERSAGLVRDLTALAPVVLFSAAVPGQGGTDHVNEQWPSYWAERFAAVGYRPLDLLRPAIWDLDDVAWWYRQNLLVFAGPGAAADLSTSGGPLDLAHPELVRRLRRAAEAPRSLGSIVRSLPPAVGASSRRRLGLVRRQMEERRPSGD